MLNRVIAAVLPGSGRASLTQDSLQSRANIALACSLHKGPFSTYIAGVESINEHMIKNSYDLTPPMARSILQNVRKVSEGTMSNTSAFASEAAGFAQLAAKDIVNAARSVPQVGLISAVSTMQTQHMVGALFNAAAVFASGPNDTLAYKLGRTPGH